MKKKVSTLKEAVNLIKDSDVIAIGGHSVRRHPMGIIYELIRQGQKDLTLLGWNSGIDMDILIGAGQVKKVETSYVGLSKFGFANNFRRAVENQEIKITEHSETTAIDMFEAASIGLSFYISKTPLGTGMEKQLNRFKTITCPFTGEKYSAIKAANPDVAIIHAHYSDIYGNIQFDQRRLMENEIDVKIAKSAKKVIVSVEQIVSEDFVLNNPHLTVIPRFFVDKVVELPFGSHPCACDTRYDYDSEFITQYCHLSKNKTSFRGFLEKYIYSSDDHYDYLQLIGSKKLFSLTRERRY